MANLPAEPPRWRAILAADCEKPSPFPRYLRGRIEVRNTTLYAIPDPPVKSGNVSRLKGSDCFIVIPAGGRGKRAGEEVEILCYQHYLQ
nr:hypothetical protein [Brevibacillus fulvus]